MKQKEIQEKINFLKLKYVDESTALSLQFDEDTYQNFDDVYTEYGLQENKSIPDSIYHNGLHEIIECLISKTIDNEKSQDLEKERYDSKYIFGKKEIRVLSNITYIDYENTGGEDEIEIPANLIPHIKGCKSIVIEFSGSGDDGGINGYEYDPKNSGDDVFRKWVQGYVRIPEEANFNNEGSYGNITYYINKKNKIITIDTETNVGFRNEYNTETKIKYEDLIKACMKQPLLLT